MENFAPAGGSINSACWKVAAAALLGAEQGMQAAFLLLLPAEHGALPKRLVCRSWADLAANFQPELWGKTWPALSKKSPVSCRSLRVPVRRSAFTELRGSF